MRSQIVTRLTSTFCFATASILFAQGPSVGSGPPPPATEACPTCPIELPLPLDENIFVLFVLAIAYGAYVAYKKYHTTNIPR